MHSLSLINDNIIQVNVYDENDKWELYVTDANFMLDKYNGKGDGNVNIISFPNLGELYGKIELYVNGYVCNNYDIISIKNGSETSFEVEPNIVILNGKNNEQIVKVFGDLNYTIENSDSRYEVIPNGSIIIVKSLTDEIFYDSMFKVKNNTLNIYEYVTVHQPSISDDNKKIFTVSPIELTYFNINEQKNIKVITNCENGYSIGNVPQPFKLIKDDKNGNITISYIGDGKSYSKREIEITSCGEKKQVSLIYEVKNEDECFLFFVENGLNEYSKTYGDDYKDEINYELESSSKINIISKPSSVTTRLVDNKLYTKLNNYNDFNGQIKLRNNEGCLAYLNLSISGKGDDNGITFKFTDIDSNTKTITSSTNEYSVDIFSYYNENKSPLNFNVKTNDFKLKSGNYKPYEPTSSSTTLTFIPNDGVSGLKTIQLEEVETYKTLYVKVNIGYDNLYYKFVFDSDEKLSYSFYLTFDQDGKLVTEMYDNIISISSSDLNFTTYDNVVYTYTDLSWVSINGVNNITAQANTSEESRSGVITFTQNESNNELKLYISQYGKNGIDSFCTEGYNFDESEVEVEPMDACDTECEFTIKNVKYIMPSCDEILNDIKLLDEDYTATYSPSGVNNTNTERMITVNVTGLNDYSNLSTSFTVTQKAGPCVPPEEPEEPSAPILLDFFVQNNLPDKFYIESSLENGTEVIGTDNSQSYKTLIRYGGTISIHVPKSSIRTEQYGICSSCHIAFCTNTPNFEYLVSHGNFKADTGDLWWIPDLAFYNGEGGDHYCIIRSGDKEIYINIHNNGD